MISKISINIKMRDIISYLLVFTAFASGWVFNQSSLFELRFSYIIMLLVFVYWLASSINLNMNKMFVAIFTVIMLASFYSVYLGNNEMLYVFKQLFGILLNAMMFYVLLRINKYDTRRLFNVYLNLALIVALIGIIQEMSFIIHFEPGYNYNFIPTWRIAGSMTGPFIRINSIMREPSGLSVLMMPALFCSITTLLRKSVRFMDDWKCCVVILSVILTFATVGYIGIVLSILIVAISNNKVKYMIASIFILVLFVMLAYNNIGDVKRRINDTVDVIYGNKILTVGSTQAVNLSTFALFTNAIVAYKSTLNYPLFGTGLGSHELSYKKYIEYIIPIDSLLRGVSEQDANSLLLRLLSETGLAGTLIVIIFIANNFILKNKDSTNCLWAINNGILVLFVLRLLRVGHYFEEGLFFFVWVYYFTKKNLRDENAKNHIDVAVK